VAVMQRCGNTSCRREQLTLALAMQPLTQAAVAALTRGNSPHARSLRTSRERRAAALDRAYSTSRVRKVPSRDSRGRFVAYSTTNTPSWYVFCCDGYRIPGATPVSHPTTNVVTRTETTPAKARKPRLWIQRGDVESLALVLLILIASAWYRLHLVVPHR
jgi:hypothetical protein